MTSMSAWARELAAEVKAAAPNAPQPVYGLSDHGVFERFFFGDAGQSAEAFHYLRDGDECFCVAAADRILWRTGGVDAHMHIEAEARRRSAGLSPRAYFVRLVAEIWP